jgi:nucleoside-diphosphate-sugar epimerase
VEYEAAVGDVLDEDSLRSAMEGVTTVFHVAGAIRARSAREFLAINGDGARALARATHDLDPAPRRIVFVSSISAAGPARDGRPRTEADEPWPVSDYGRSKLVGERALLDLPEQVEGVVLRPPVVYGPGDTATLPLFRMGRWGLVAHAGVDGALSFIHVDDLVDAMILAAVRPGLDRRVLYVAGPEDGKISDLQSAIVEALGRRPRHVSVPTWLLRVGATLAEAGRVLGGAPPVFGRDKLREALQQDWRVDASAARSLLGWEPSTRLRDGARGAAAWYRTEGWI